MIVLFQCVAEAVMAKGVKGLAELVPGGGYLFDVAQEALRRLKERKRADQLKAEVVQAAAATFEEAKELAEKVAREVAAAAPTEDRIALELYLTQIPGAVRQSLRRAEDPSGKTAPANLALDDPDDLLRRLPARAARLRPGDPLSGRPGWKLVELLGTGGFGEVWLARNPSLSALKGAVKFGLDPRARDRLLRHEGALVNRVMEQGKHPNVVQLLDAHLEGDAPWLMYEYVPGGDLTGLIYAWQNLPPGERERRTVAALRTLAAAVGHFHRLSPPIVHRDLKPSNILVDPASPGREPGESLKVADFGIGGVAASAALAEAATRRSSTGVLVSQLAGSFTPLYASPQQQNGDPPDPRDDVHALGVIGFQMLTGRLDATLGADYAKTLRKLGVGEPLIELLGDCAAHDPENRPRDAVELAERLTAPAGPVPPKKAESSAAARPHEPDDRPRRTVVREEGRRRGTWAGLLLALAVFVCCLGLPAFLLVYGWTSLGPGSPTAVTSASRPQPPEQVQRVEPKLAIRGLKGQTAEVLFSPTGSHVATVSADGVVQLWDAHTGQAVREIPTGIDGHVPAFTPDGRRLATTAHGELRPVKDVPNAAKQAGQNIGLWPTAVGMPLEECAGLGDTPARIAISPDGRWLAAGGPTAGTVRVWDLTRAAKDKPFQLQNVSGDLTHSDAGEPLPIAAVVFDPQGHYLATAGGSEVKLWRVADWPDRIGYEDTLTHAAKVAAVAFDHEGKRVAAGGTDGTVRVWETGKKGAAPRDLARHLQRPVARVAFSSNGRHLAALDVAGNGAVWDRPNYPSGSMNWHTGQVVAFAFNPEGSLLATAGGDQTVRFWDQSLERPISERIEVGRRVVAIAYSPDGNRVAVADADGNLTIWLVPNPRKKP